MTQRAVQFRADGNSWSTSAWHKQAFRHTRLRCVTMVTSRWEEERANRNDYDAINSGEEGKVPQTIRTLTHSRAEHGGGSGSILYQGKVRPVANWKRIDLHPSVGLILARIVAKLVHTIDASITRVQRQATVCEEISLSKIVFFARKVFFCSISLSVGWPTSTLRYHTDKNIKKRAKKRRTPFSIKQTFAIVCRTSTSSK